MSNLQKYNQSAIDKTFPDAEETVFGHLIAELGMKPAQAVQKLRPWVKDYVKSTRQAKSLLYGFAGVGVVAGAAAGALMTFGFAAALPILAGLWCFNDGRSSSNELQRREAEYMMLKECPELLKIIYGLNRRGASAEVLVEAYDDLVGSFQSAYFEGSEVGMSGQIDIDKRSIVALFRTLFDEKRMVAGIASEIMDEFKPENLDELYDREEDAPMLGQGATVQRAIEPVRQVGNYTRMNALPVATEDTEEELTVREFIDSTPAPRDIRGKVEELQEEDYWQEPIQPKPPEDWVKALASKPQNLFVGAKGGTGKGIFLSNYARLRKAAQPKLKVFVIDPKNDPKEHGYWKEDWIEYRGFSAIAMDTEEIVYKLRELFSEYIGLMGNPDEAWLLICDECLLITDELGNAGDRGTKRLLASQITRVVSVGDSFDRNICVVSQSANAGDLGLSAGVMKTLTKVILFRDGDEESLNHLYKHGQIVVEPSKPMLKNILSQSPVGRGAYVANAFKPVPRLTNYSSYDRDTRSVIQTGVK